MNEMIIVLFLLMIASLLIPYIVNKALIKPKKEKQSHE